MPPLDAVLRLILVGISIIAVLIMTAVWSALSALQNRSAATAPLADRARSGQGNALRHYRVVVENDDEDGVVTFRQSAASRALLSDVRYGRASHAVFNDTAFDVSAPSETALALKFVAPALTPPIGIPLSPGTRPKVRAGEELRILAF
jgi:hypothetical protein